MCQRKGLERDLRGLNLREQFAQVVQRVSGSDVFRTHPFYSEHAESPKHSPALFSNCIVWGAVFDNRLIYALRLFLLQQECHLR